MNAGDTMDERLRDGTMVGEKLRCEGLMRA